MSFPYHYYYWSRALMGSNDIILKFALNISWRTRARIHPPLESWNYVNNAVFIRIPKTASTSIIEALGIEHYQEHIGLHTLYRLDPELVERAFIFAVIRNPWDRFVSSYHYCKKRAKEGDPHMKKLLVPRDFSDFINLMRRNVWFYNFIRAHVVFSPQSLYLSGPASLLSKVKLLRLEQLQQDWEEKVMPHLPVASVLPHKNRSNRTDYRHYYTRQSDIEMVAQLYRDDIRLFSYKF